MAIIPNFAVLEGGDGSGTTTQLNILKSRFAELGFLLLYTTFEPTDGPIGKIIRSALRGDLRLQRETIARLFAADRYEHLYGPDGILERCSRGELVVSDRYTPSSLVYQGIDCGEELPRLLNAAFPAPELLLFFDVDPQTAIKRLEGRAWREVYEHLDFQMKVRTRYKTIIPEYEAQGSRVVSIDATASVEDVARQVWRAIQKMPIMARWSNNGAV